jgi:hypothetical protein
MDLMPLRLTLPFRRDGDQALGDKAGGSFGIRRASSPAGPSAATRDPQGQHRQPRDQLKSESWLEIDENGRIDGKSREAFRQVIKLLAEGFQAKDGMIWRTRPHPARAAALVSSPV